MLSALFVSNTGTSLQLTAQAWLIWQSTHSPRALGLLGLVQASPPLGLPLLGGLLADRYAHRSLLLLTQTTLGVVAAAMGGLVVAGIRAPLIILPCAGLLAAVAALDNPIRQVYLPGVVGRDQRPRMVGLNALSFNGGAVVGPTIAGVLLPRVGPGPCLLLNAASYLAVIALLAGGPAGRPSGSRGGGVWGGVAYLRTAARPRDVLLLVALVSLLGRSYAQVLPVLVARSWHGSAQAYGTLAALPGVGAACAAALVALVPRRSVGDRLRSIGPVVLGLAVAALQARRRVGVRSLQGARTTSPSGCLSM